MTDNIHLLLLSLSCNPQRLESCADPADCLVLAYIQNHSPFRGQFYHSMI